MSDRAAGNALFGAGKYEEALAVYDALEDDALALSNGAEACLLLHRFAEARSRCLQALQLQPDHVKSLSRLARALAGEDRPAEAHLMTARIPNLDERLAAHLRVTETLDNCTLLYLSGAVVEDVRGDGSAFRLVASRDLKPGEVVIREKPYAPFTRRVLLLDDATERNDFLDYLLNTPQGTAFSRVTQGVFPRGPPPQGMYDQAEELASDPEDVERIARGLAVLFFSSFETGLYLFASLFDHSCRPNCDSYVMDESCNLIEWRTNTLVLAGTPLFISYMDLNTLLLPKSFRQEVFARNWGGTPCQCYCCAEEEESNLTSREAVELFSEHFSNYIKDVPYNFTNEAIENLMRNKVDLNWRNQRWKEFIILGWYTQHCRGFILRKAQLKRVLNFGGHLGRAIDRVLEYYDLVVQTLLPERSNLLREIRDCVIDMLKLAAEIDGDATTISSKVLSRRLKNQEEMRSLRKRFEELNLKKTK